MKKGLLPIAKTLENMIKEELQSQNHIAKKNLYNSIEVIVAQEIGGWKIVGKYLYYGDFVESGRKAGVKRVPLDVLIEWIKDKKINLRGKDERSVAFAIQAAIFKKGIPTDGDDKKKKFVSRTLEDNEKQIEKMIRDAVYVLFEASINHFITNTQIEIK